MESPGIQGIDGSAGSAYARIVLYGALTYQGPVMEADGKFAEPRMDHQGALSSTSPREDAGSGSSNTTIADPQLLIKAEVMASQDRGDPPPPCVKMVDI